MSRCNPVETAAACGRFLLEINKFPFKNNDLRLGKKTFNNPLFVSVRVSPSLAI